MSVDRVEYDRLPANLNTWQEWLRHHCIDPDAVTVPGWIERDPGARRIMYWGYAQDSEGCLVSDSGDRTIRAAPRVMQLEAVPSPLPEFVPRPPLVT